MVKKFDNMPVKEKSAYASEYEKAAGVPNDVRILMELMGRSLGHNKSVGELRADGIKEMAELSVVNANGDIDLLAFNMEFNSHLAGLEANHLEPDGKPLSPSDAKAMYVDSLARGAQADPAFGETHKEVLQAMCEAERNGETRTVQELQAS